MTTIGEAMTAGVKHHLAGRLDGAIACYSRVVEALPDYGEAWRLLGIIALQSGDNQAARELLLRATRIDPKDAEAFSALGNVAEADGNLEQAYQAYMEAHAIDPTQNTGTLGLMRTSLRLGRAAEASAIGEAALERGRVDARFLRILGAARLQARDYAQAADAFLASLRIEPHADAYANLGAAYVHLQQVESAIVACNDALALDASHAKAANNLGVACKANREFRLAAAVFEHAVHLGSEDAHVNLGTTRLLLGDFGKGWPHYGWVTAERRASQRFKSLPMWDGKANPGQHVLIWPEQGVGDTIQMARFLRRARALVGSVTLACLPETIDLLQTLDGVDAFVDMREQLQLDAFDVWLPTIRLPVVFDVRPQSLLTEPYLFADPSRVERFRPRLQAPARLRVGLVWSGNPQHEWDDLRSCPLAELEPLHQVSGVEWFSLQQGPSRAQQPRNGMRLVPVNADVADFADTAAILDQLDLLITIDTSVAHLAGALGTTAWVLLSNRPDWRWQLTGETSAWYPTLRLFRQGDDGAWVPVIAQVAAALHELASLPKG